MVYTAFEADGQLWEFTVVPFGVTNGVPSFQRVMDKVVKEEGLDDTFPYLDNITVCGRTPEELRANDERFKSAVKKYDINLNDFKTAANKSTIPLMGYVVSQGVMKPDPERMRPLMEMPLPHDEPSQKRVLGMFAHYSRWIQNFSTKIHLLSHNKTFPVPADVAASIDVLKEDLKSAALRPIDPSVPLVVETDASDHAIAASLNQDGRPIAFFSRMLNASELHHPPVEKEAYAIVESLKYWKHFLLGRRFTLITDQRSVSFMFDNRKHGKIKNDKIARWRMDLSDYHYDIIYRPGKENRCAHTLSRNSTTTSACAALLYFPKDDTPTIASTTSISTKQNLKQIHDALCHPGVTPFNHFVKSRNLPHSVGEVKQITETCPDCCELKPSFLKTSGTLIHATQPFQRLNIDFKGPLPTSTQYKYILTLVDEYSRFPFAFPCKDMTSTSVISCFNQLFAVFGMPGYIHNDRAQDFLSQEVKDYLNNHGIATSRTSRYNPRGNGQCERYNGIIWKTVLLALRTKNLPTTEWQQVLPDALHSIRTLLCTATNCTPHERMFHHQRRSSSGNSMPSWLMNPGPVYVRKHARKSKYDPLVERVELIHANPEYAFVRFENGRESTVSLRDVAPVGGQEQQTSTNPTNISDQHSDQFHIHNSENWDQELKDVNVGESSTSEAVDGNQVNTPTTNGELEQTHQEQPQTPPTPTPKPTPTPLRRSTRPSNPPQRYHDEY